MKKKRQKANKYATCTIHIFSVFSDLTTIRTIFTWTRNHTIGRPPLKIYRRVFNLLYFFEYCIFILKRYYKLIIQLITILYAVRVIKIISIDKTSIVYSAGLGVYEIMRFYFMPLGTSVHVSSMPSEKWLRTIYKISLNLKK